MTLMLRKTAVALSIVWTTLVAIVLVGEKVEVLDTTLVTEVNLRVPPKSPNFKPLSPPQPVADGRSVRWDRVSYVLAAPCILVFILVYLYSWILIKPKSDECEQLSNIAKPPMATKALTEEASAPVLSKPAKLRIVGGVILVFNFWLIGHFGLEGVTVLLLTFGFALGFEYFVVRPAGKKPSRPSGQ
jgi:hypothetical protein